jgi:HSP20 family protein
MSTYKLLPCAPRHQFISKFSYHMPASRITPHINKFTKSSTRNMSVFFPRVAFGPSRCAPAIARQDFAPLFSLFDDTVNELARSQRHHGRRTYAPRFDVKEAKESYHLEGELPGISQENISIEFTDEHTLTIKGRSERHTVSAAPSEAVEAGPAQADGTATPTSDDASVKSLQATVEDENATSEAKGKEVESQPEAKPEAAALKAAALKAAAPKEHFWFSERRVGEFSRSFSFTDRVDQEAVKASLKNGILSIVVPKAPKPESRRINIE